MTEQGGRRHFVVRLHARSDEKGVFCFDVKTHEVNIETQVYYVFLK